tara:strand:- start:399 stop:611 length:213 start_codon:yes stop_codon:yes gene_type:complete
VVSKKQIANALDAWVFVGFMNKHLPLMRAALEHYAKANKVPPKYRNNFMVLLYIVEGAIEKIEGDNDDCR